MKNSKKKKLEAKGWKIGSVDEFLGLTKEESEFVRVKLALAHHLKIKRLGKHYSQMEFAKHIKSSQSRVAKMEQGDPSVSMDLLIHSLLSLGTTRKELAEVIG
ncbi:MAG: helix-turn-helix transcriptional regulator [Deltaproteobacteria bacterium]|nr:helix-turn-helix transcriptional regulator [Deltaproteobacteria bacterium]